MGGFSTLAEQYKQAVSDVSFKPADMIRRFKANIAEAAGDKSGGKTNAVAQPKPPVVHDLGHYSSLADLQAHGYAHDEKTRAVMEARQLKNPTQAPTNTLKLQAVTGKLQRLKENPKFQGLRPENKVKVLGDYYDRYVAPVMKLNGIEPPNKEDWLAGYGSEETYRQSIDPRSKDTAAGIFSSGLVSAEGSVLHALNNFIFTPGIIESKILGQKEIAQKLTEAKETNPIIRASRMFARVSTDYDGAFATRDDWRAWAANFGGHMLGESQAFMLAGEAIPSLGEVALLGSRGTKVAYGALKTASEIALVDKAESISNKQTLQDAAFGASLGVVFPALAKTIGRKAGGANVTVAEWLRYKQAKLAVGGKPFVRSIEDIAEVGEESSEPETERKTASQTEAQSSRGPRARVNPQDPDAKNTASAERSVHENLARKFFPEKAQQAGERSIWRNLSKEQRAKIRALNAAGDQKAAELMPLTQPKIQRAKNALALEAQMKQDPEFAQALQSMSKITGIDPAIAVTKSQAKEVARSNGLNNPIHQIETTYDNPETSFGRVKGRSTVSDANLSSRNISLDDFIKGTRKFLEANPVSPSGKDWFANPQHHLLWIAKQSDAPLAIKGRAMNFLRQSMTQEQIDKASGWLANHYSDLVETQKLYDPQYQGRIFQDTKLTQRRFGTSTQKKLYTEDIKATDLKEIRSLLKAQPQLRESVVGLLDTLTQLRNKAQTPLVSKTRRETQKAIRDILARYK